MIILNIPVREVLTEKGTFNQRPKGREEESHAGVLGNSIPVRNNDKCKGPETGALYELEGQKGDGMAEAGLVQDRIGKECQIGEYRKKW